MAATTAIEATANPACKSRRRGRAAKYCGGSISPAKGAIGFGCAGGPRHCDRHRRFDEPVVAGLQILGGVESRPLLRSVARDVCPLGCPVEEAGRIDRDAGWQVGRNRTVQKAEGATRPEHALCDRALRGRSDPACDLVAVIQIAEPLPGVGLDSGERTRLENQTSLGRIPLENERSALLAERDPLKDLL